MNTVQRPAASRAPRAPDETPTTEETLAAHARRALFGRLRTRIIAVLDGGIAALQGLRIKAGGTHGAEAEADRTESGFDRPRKRQASTEAPAEVETPRPRRRLRAFMIHVALMLVGGLGGGALAYTQFQTQLDRQREASRVAEAARAKDIRPRADALKTFEEELARRDRVEKKLAAAFAEFSASTDTSYTLLKTLLGQQFAENRRLQATLAENVQSGAAARQALEKEQTARTEAETRLASALAEHAQSTREKQQQLDAAEKQLALLLDSATPRSIQRDAPASRRDADGRSRSPKSANLTLNARNIGALKGCIDEFNQ